ncbi:uncharacterized protein LOC132923129 [Rhopalosiphum padi]|uniref:uncharacterized protein LOC132923129 n=1 Tax=Rhopalosiphum padi TaxID=40932 RepID=UPI00298DE606|nr:uncharacterized protein LOC132923129 [Rhopalosiphum padi]
MAIVLLNLVRHHQYLQEVLITMVTILVQPLMRQNHLLVLVQRLEGLLLNEMENNFEPRTNNNSATSPTSPPLLAPPPKPARDTGRRSQNSDDIFGLSPFKATPRPAGQPRTSASDPFGMDDFGQSVQNGIENDIGLLDKRIKEMKDGFSRGLSMSTEDFSLESLDPLKK